MSRAIPSVVPFLVVFYGVAVDALAQQDPAIQLRQEQRQHQREEDAHSPPAKLSAPAETPALDGLPGDLAEPHSRLLDAKVAVRSNELLDQAEIDRIVTPYQSLALGERRIALLIRQLNAALVRRGFVTSRARIARLDPTGKALEIELVAGRIEAFKESDKPLGMGLHNAFPAREGDALVLGDLEQGVHQIQRLRMYQAEIRILPGQSPATNLIDLQLTRGKPWWLQLGLDNQGSEATGTQRARGTFGLDDSLGLLDSLAFTYVHSRDSDALLGALSIPQGYNTWSLSAAASRYTQALPVGLQQRGGSSTATMGWNRVLHLAADGRDSADLTLAYSDGWRKIGGISLTPERLTVMRGTLTRVRLLYAHIY
jgi:hemolysin activation/secretion protein